MSLNRNILIITYYWPPSGGVGVQRWMNYAIQLKKRGWNPIILTPANPQLEIKDDGLLKRVEGISVFKIPIWEPFDLFHKLTGNKDRKNVQQGLVLEKSEKSFKDKLMVWIRGNLLIPDPRVFWVRPAIKEALKVIDKEGVSTLITTGPPHSIHLIGKGVKRKSQKIKWLADFRDPWGDWDILDKLHSSALVKQIHRRLEASVKKHADVSLTVSKRLAKALGGVEVLHNGVTVESTEISDPSDTSFTIGYFGMLNELRNPSRLWQLLDQLCRENQVFAAKLQVRIGGIVAESIQEQIRSLDQLKGKVEFLGYLPHDQMLKEYARCNVLLLLLNKSGNANWILPIKFFEYLAAKRMILGLGDRESDLGDLMNTRDVGEILNYEDVTEIRGFIENVFENQRRPSQDDVAELLRQFSHESLVKVLEKLISGDE